MIASGAALSDTMTKLIQVIEAESGGLMPQKSTYFHPKLATGLTVNPLT